MKRLLVLALGLALGVTATACSDSTGPGESLAGTYSLQTVNGQPLPVVVESNSQIHSEVVLAQIVLRSDGRYQSITRYRDTYPNQQPILVDETFDGYWTLSGNQLALVEDGFPNDPTYGTISNDRITISEFGFTLVYTR